MAEDAERTQSTPRPSAFVHFVEGIGLRVMRSVSNLGGLFSLGFQVVRSTFAPPFRVQNIFAQLDFVGVGFIFIVCLTGLFTGMVFAQQSMSAFALFDAESLVGPTVGLVVTRGLAPVFSALMVTMRAVSAMCTELGTMRVTEQVDALETMAVNPVQYLLVPRVLAGLIMLPMLVMLFDAMGLMGAYLVAVMLKGISAGTFIARTRQWLDPEDLVEGLVKGAVFGLTVTLVGSYKGYAASGGAKGVGQATTEAMVTSALSIFILDYLLGLIFH